MKFLVKLTPDILFAESLNYNLWSRFPGFSSFLGFSARFLFACMYSCILVFARFMFHMKSYAWTFCFCWENVWGFKANARKAKKIESLSCKLDVKNSWRHANKILKLGEDFKSNETKNIVPRIEKIFPPFSISTDETIKNNYQTEIKQKPIKIAWIEKVTPIIYNWSAARWLVSHLTNYNKPQLNEILKTSTLVIADHYRQLIFHSTATHYIKNVIK